MSQKISITIEVQTNAKVTPEKVAKILQGLIDSGLEDAQRTIENNEGDVRGAKLATDLNISKPTVFKPTAVPRVLVTVQGGVAEVHVSDEAVDVELYDFDNESEDDDSGVSPHFADLAEPCGVPVKVSSDVPRGG